MVSHEHPSHPSSPLLGTSSVQHSQDIPSHSHAPITFMKELKAYWISFKDHFEVLHLGWLLWLLSIILSSSFIHMVFVTRIYPRLGTSSGYDVVMRGKMADSSSTSILASSSSWSREIKELYPAASWAFRNEKDWMGRNTKAMDMKDPTAGDSLGVYYEDDGGRIHCVCHEPPLFDKLFGTTSLKEYASHAAASVQSEIVDSLALSVPSSSHPDLSIILLAPDSHVIDVLHIEQLLSSISTTILSLNMTAQLILCIDFHLISRGSTHASFGVDDIMAKYVGNNFARLSITMLRFNGLRVTRVMNRAMRLANAPVTLVLSADLILSTQALFEPGSRENFGHASWLITALKLFKTDSELAILGGTSGSLWDYSRGKDAIEYEYGDFGEPQNASHQAAFSEHVNRSRTTSYAASDKSQSASLALARIPFVHPVLEVPFMYVECAWMEPVWFLRTKSFNDLEGFDLRLATIYEENLWQDCILCFEAWTHGFRVGLYNSGLSHLYPDRKSKASIVANQIVLNRTVEISHLRYDRKTLKRYVARLNSRLQMRTT